MSIYEFLWVDRGVLASWQAVVVRREWLDEPVCQQSYRQFISTRPFVAIKSVHVVPLFVAYRLLQAMPSLFTIKCKPRCERPFGEKNNKR